MTSRTASCQCGQLSVEVHSEPLAIGICHCLACQQRTGSVFAALAAFRGPYEVTGKAIEYVRTGDQGSRFRFRFCPVCGSTVFHSEEGHEGSIGVAVGCLADPSFPAPQISVYDCRRHPWVELPAGAVAHEKDPE
ncbi:GFA family protein [soil metagenome]